MSCPVWDLPQFARDHWDLETLCDLMECGECTAEPEDMPWLSDEERLAEFDAYDTIPF